jgi:phosphatidate cytidylyltransferase
VLSVAVVIWLWALIAIINYQKNGLGAGFQFPIIRSLIGFIVLIATGISIIALKTDPNFGPRWLILVLVIIWGADVGGYFAGRSLGKRALCSRVSPKKTWEGFAGGILLSVVLAAIGGLFLSLTFSHYIYLLGLALITALFSVVGDLGVSLLKRMSGVKDSGKFFPGHGGMLDRLDSIAAATVIFVFGAMLLGL